MSDDELPPEDAPTREAGAEVADVELVVLETVFVYKRRFRKLGLRLEGTHHPRVHSSTHPMFRTGDVIYVINGREAIHAQRVAQRIRYGRHLSITLWRRL